MIENPFLLDFIGRANFKCECQRKSLPSISDSLNPAQHPQNADGRRQGDVSLVSFLRGETEGVFIGVISGKQIHCQMVNLLVGIPLHRIHGLIRS